MAIAIINPQCSALLINNPIYFGTRPGLVENTSWHVTRRSKTSRRRPPAHLDYADGATIPQPCAQVAGWFVFFWPLTYRAGTLRQVMQVTGDVRSNKCAVGSRSR